MFELKITGLTEALHLSQHWATHTVSLVDPDYTLETPKPGENAPLRRYSFHDITHANYFDSDEFDFILATPEHIRDILEFTAPLQSSDRLLVHCHAGISRSTAVACGILCQHGLFPNLAVKLMLSIRPQASPNLHIISLFDDRLKLNGQLKKAVFRELSWFYPGMSEEEES